MNVIPKPNHIEFLGGLFPVLDNVRINFGEFECLREILTEQIEAYTKLKLQSDTKTYFNINIYQNKVIELEGYIMSFDGNSFEIEASSNEGIYYAFQTLIQILSNHNELICFRIIDAPKLTHRGFMLDVSRNYFEITQVKKMIDTASRLKFNRFHWHLTDDHGWRIHLDAFPELTTKANNNQHQNLYYTKKEIEEIIEYASKRMVSIIPEIDMPGHILSLLQVMPELSCEPKDFQLAQGPGISEEVLCLGNEYTYKVMYKILDEIASIFKSNELHIGGDEVPKTRWLSCDKCRTFAESHQIYNPNLLQAHFLQKMIDHINNKGKSVILWNDSCMDVSFNGDVICQFWMTTDKSNGIKKLSEKYRIIDSNFKFYYLDYPIEMRGLKNCYNYQSLFNKLDLYGIECPIWTEWIDSEQILSERIFPRLMAISEVSWTRSELKNYSDFENRLVKQYNWWEDTGTPIVNHEKWNTGGLSQFKHTLRHMTKMLDLKTIKIAMKMQKQNNIGF